MPAPQTQHPHRNPPPIALAAVVVAVTAVALAIFAWPQARPGPSDLPIGVAGPEPAANALAQGLTRAGDFDIVRYAGEPEAAQAIADREVYGALVASPADPTLLTAPAASPAVAQLLEGAFAAATAGAGAPDGTPQTAEARVVEVVAGSAEDPRGAAFAASILPLILIGIVTGVLGSRAGGGLRRPAGFLLGASALAGLTAVAVIQGWLGVIEGGWGANAGALALVVLAIAAPVTALVRLIDIPGVGVAALAFVLLGNPWSGASSAPELLPAPLGTIGQLLPPGAGADLLRGTGFFDGAGTAGALLVLAAWALAGLGALALASRRATGAALGEAGGPEPAPASG